MKIDDIKATVNREAVFQMIHCTPEIPGFDTIKKVYETLLPDVLSRAKCSCIFDIGAIQKADASEVYPAGTRVIYVISTVGKELSELSAELFDGGEYSKGMLADAMADSILFEMEAQWMQELQAFCKVRNIGIARRLEAPINLPISVQKTAFEFLNAREKLGMEITSAYMYDPVKSSCVVFVISEDPCQFQAEHDCSKCPAVNCSMRNRKMGVSPEAPMQSSAEAAIRITVASGENRKEIFCEKQESILSACQRQLGVGTAVCGGKGTCGKCRIRIVEGELPITDADRRSFAQKELDAGWRLACFAHPEKNCTIEISYIEETGFEVLETFEHVRTSETAVNQKLSETAAMSNDAEKRIGIAVDIGTTTLAACLVNLKNGEILASASAMNRQRILGADVISRIEAASAGKDTRLRELVQTDIRKLVQTLLKKAAIPAESVDKMIFAGNTTMIHLLMGYSCEGLGMHPFRPVNIGIIRNTYRTVVGVSDEIRRSIGTVGAADPDCEVWIMPGISAFVGGDIVSGLYAMEAGSRDKPILFVDLGTNGEMALVNGGRLLVASTAAGPAFEGGNISCGTGSIPGAISHVHLDEKRRPVVKTIQDQIPVGICGTGVTELVSELLKAGLIDESGLLHKEYFEEGYPVAITPDGNEITFTQQDVREIQLAKSAIRAGIELLMRERGFSSDEISRIYLAGGMGYQMDRDAAAAIGLFPRTLRDKISAVGNSSLAGAVRALTDDNWQQSVSRLVEIAQEKVLANDPDFHEYYLNYMMFESNYSAGLRIYCADRKKM